jgi:hypothetical protein
MDKRCGGWMVAIVLACGTASAGGYGSTGRFCTGDGPCGPVGLEWAIPQGFAGADFRPACARHDRCYATPGASRRDCDRQFSRGLHSACANSRHPVLCHMTAGTMSVVTRLLGGPAFRGSQRGWYTNRGMRWR